ncbi:MAG: VIT1/CCC1 transporter family protein [Thermoplasmata archaeon]
MASTPIGGPGHEVHAEPGFLSDFILGSQDGLVNVLGIVLGLAATGQGRFIIIVAAMAALAAESVSMGAVAYTSTRARRQLYLSERRREEWEMEHVPIMEQQEIREILHEWDIEGDELESMLQRIIAKPKMMLDLMMAFELHLAPVEASQPGRSASVVFLATLVGSIIPLLPFLLGVNLSIMDAAIIAVVLSALVLFLVGWYEARTTIGSMWESGLRMILIGLAAGGAGFLAGYLLNILAPGTAA